MQMSQLFDHRLKRPPLIGPDRDCEGSWPWRGVEYDGAGAAGGEHGGTDCCIDTDAPHHILNKKV